VPRYTITVYVYNDVCDFYSHFLEISIAARKRKERKKERKKERTFLRFLNLGF